jgi:hypothetical protein
MSDFNRVIRAGSDMKRPGLQFALILSLLLNLGVIGAIGYLAVKRGQLPVVFDGGAGEANLPDYLKLSAEQRRRWHDLETGFLKDLSAEWRQIRPHRENMLNEIFSERPDRDESKPNARQSHNCRLAAAARHRTAAQERDTRPRARGAG